MPAVQKRGWLTKQGHFVPSWKRRYFILIPPNLYYYKNAGPPHLVRRNFVRADEEPSTLADTLKGVILLNPSTKIETTSVAGKPHAFLISNPDKTFLIVADSDESREEWLTLLRAAAEGAPDLEYGRRAT